MGVYETLFKFADRTARYMGDPGTHPWAQRTCYRQGLEGLGFELYTGDGGFYHWGKLPGDLSADEFNERLFKYEAGILPGDLCDMARRRGEDGPLYRFIRFFFGPLSPDSCDSDMENLAKCV